MVRQDSPVDIPSVVRCKTTHLRSCAYVSRGSQPIMILRTRPLIIGSTIVSRALGTHPTIQRTPVVCRVRRGFSTQDPEIRESVGEKFTAAPPPVGDPQNEHIHTPGSNDEVARLAAMPLPTLTLQDLVRYATAHLPRLHC